MHFFRSFRNFLLFQKLAIFFAFERFLGLEHFLGFEHLYLFLSFLVPLEQFWLHMQSPMSALLTQVRPIFLSMFRFHWLHALSQPLSAAQGHEPHQVRSRHGDWGSYQSEGLHWGDVALKGPPLVEGIVSTMTFGK